MKLLLLAIPASERPSTLPKAVKNNWDKFISNYNVIGRTQPYQGTDYRLLDCLCYDRFIADGEVDENGDPITSTPIPKGWIKVRVWKINKKVVEYTEQDPVIIPANEITDGVFNHRKYFAKYYVQPQFYTSDYRNPVLTGCRFLNVDYTSYILKYNAQGDPVYTIPVGHASFDSNYKPGGPFILRWTTPAKVISDTGLKVLEEELNPDGTYTYVERTSTVVVPRFTLLESNYTNNQILNYWPNNSDGSRPTSLRELVSFVKDDSRY